MMLNQQGQSEDRSIQIGDEVVTETGQFLGRVCRLKHDLESGCTSTIVLASFRLGLIPEHFVSTYELSVDEIISRGCDRLIVFEGSEERLIQLSVGVLERFGIGSPLWERDEEDDYSNRNMLLRTALRGKLDDRDDLAGGNAPSPRPRNPTPKPITDEAAATPD